MKGVKPCVHTLLTEKNNIGSKHESELTLNIIMQSSLSTSRSSEPQMTTVVGNRDSLSLKTSNSTALSTELYSVQIKDLMRSQHRYFSSSAESDTSWLFEHEIDAQFIANTKLVGCYQHLREKRFLLVYEDGRIQSVSFDGQWNVEAIDLKNTALDRIAECKITKSFDQPLLVLQGQNQYIVGM